MQDATSPTAGAAGNRKRPRLDLTTDSRERKRGKTMFGLVLGTLNKAKREDSERNNSEAVRRLWPIRVYNALGAVLTSSCT